MTQIRAVLFDFGGTLFDYETVAPGERESIVELARWAGVEADSREILRAYRGALKRVFYDYLPRPYYLHRDLFRDALQEHGGQFGVTLSDDLLARYRERQWECRARFCPARRVRGPWTLYVNAAYTSESSVTLMMINSDTCSH
jgi:FMN phosphatase YigB (HAD superfamily)